MKIVYGSDTHLQSGAWASRAEISGDAHFAFQQMCQELQPGDVLLLAGDVLDKPQPDPVTLLQAQRELQDRDVEVLFITGQHDQHARGLWLELWPRARCIHKQQLELAGLRIYGLNYAPASTIQADLAAIPAGTDVLVAHQTWAELCPQPQCAISDIPQVTQLWTGDYHDHMVLRHTGRDGQEILVYSPGSTAMQDIAEPPDKAFFIWENDEMRSVPLRTRELYAMEVDHLDGVGALLNWIPEYDVTLPEALQKPLLRVQLYGDATRYRADIEAHCRGIVHLFLSTIQPRAASAARRQQQAAHSLADAARLFVPVTAPGRHVLFKLLEAEHTGQPLKQLLTDLTPI